MHKEIEKYLSELPDHELTVDALRQTMMDARQKYGLLPPLARVEKTKIADFDVWDLFPSNYSEKQPVIVYVHGGGGMVGGLESFEPIAREIAYFSGCRVLAIDYPLAPEYPFPAQKEHLEKSIQEIQQKVDLTMGWVLVGEGFSASLTVEMAIEYQPDKFILLVPLLDWSFSHPSHQQYNQGFGLDGNELEFFRSQYLQANEDIYDENISPLFRKDLNKLPKCYIFTAECDPLRDDGEVLSSKCANSTLERAPGMIHWFLYLKTIVPEIVKFYIKLGKIIRNEES
jgi:acetyl esterase